LSTGDVAYKPIEQYILRYRKPGEAVPIAEAIMRHSKTYDVNPKLVAALIRRESGFNPRAVSTSGACGLGQLLPSTCKTTGVTQPFDINDNAKGTVRYMKYLLDKFKAYNDQVSFALAGYLEGPNQVARNRGYSSKTAGYVRDIIDIYNKI
jgi:soluble lytic murein transglycosylase-like protein